MAPRDPSRERWSEIRALFEEMLELEPEARGACLEEARADDPELAAEVAAMLAADERAGGFLESPVGDYAATLLDEIPAASEAVSPRERLDGLQLGPYRLVRHLGSGGMGEVWEARDDRLDRTVAVKLLPPAWSGEPDTQERFLREARSAAALDHPNVCTVHDVGVSPAGRPFIVMPRYAGETLTRKLANGPLPVRDAVDLAIQAARGLERAHAAGIVHRDVKPSNLMVTEHGELKILDFGIAKLAGEAGLTLTGTSPGTPAYMSPEQAAGEPADHRSDLWALGAVLYEMLAGRRPFAGEHPQAVLHAILEREPDPLPPEVPAALAGTVTKALAKDPGERYQSAGELLADLDPGARSHRRWLPRATASAAVLGLLLMVSWAISRTLDLRTDQASLPAAEPAVHEAPVVAVIPFVNRTGDPRLDWYGEGVARLVMDDLARSRHLHVASDGRVAHLLADEEAGPLAQRAAASGVGVLLTGEILAGREGLTLAARLGETPGGQRLAARRIDGLEPAGLLEAAAAIAREARKGLGVPLTEAVDVFAADFAAANPEAYESYLLGLRAFAEYRYEKAEHGFAAALESAPDFTIARYRLAHVLAVTSRTDEALTEIQRAVAEADRLPDRDARYVRAAEALIDRRYDEAITHYRELLEIYPYETEARYLLADLLDAEGRFEEELEQARVLARLEPNNHVTWSLSGSANLALGRLHQAVVDFERYVKLEPDSANAHHLLADAYRAQGELDLAAGEYAAALRADPAFHFSSVALAALDVLSGRPAAAEERLAAVVADPEASARHRLDAAFELASLQRAGGRFRQACATLKQHEPLIVRERVREPMALAVRGASRMELDELDDARRLLNRAVERSSGTRTRYLFARGILEIREQRFAALKTTMTEILQDARPPEDPNRTVEKAVAYLQGLRFLTQGDAEAAIAELSRAVALEGYEYTVYRSALARAYLETGRLREAMAAARQSARERDPQEPRLDLELDRARALLVLARVQEALGRPAEAAALARELMERWAEADPGRPEIAEARRLVTGAS